jgi:hypothetical protein
MNAVLGTILDGDIHQMVLRVGKSDLGKIYGFAFSWEQMVRHALIIGGTGTGKTVTQMRLMSSFMSLSLANPGEPPIRIIFIDAKGLADKNKTDFLELARSRGYQNINTWPEEPLDGFQGDVNQLRERLSGLFNSGESAFHHAESVSMLDLALNAGEPPRTLQALLERVRPGATENLYGQIATVESLIGKQISSTFSNNQWNSLYLRLRALKATVGEDLDSSELSWALDTTDAAWISIPGTSSPQAAGDIAAWVLAMLGELATMNDGRKTLVFLDEFSAIGNDQRASRTAAGLVERTRSAGMALVIGSQTTDSLGESAIRLLQTAGTVICHRNPAPENICELAGTIDVWEDTHELNANGGRSATSGRLQQQFRVSPELVRSLPVGECVVISAGRWAHVAVSHPSESGI